MSDVKIRHATLADHKEISRFANRSPYTKGFSAFRSLPDYYAKGHIGVARDDDGRGKVVGFVCVVHLKRKPYSNLYYMGVDESIRGKGLGRSLLIWAATTSPWNEIRLNCEKVNTAALKFYDRLGFEKIGMGTNKDGVEHYTLAIRWKKGATK